MRIHFVATICAAVVGASILSAPAFAKTEKECQDEWRANRAANQAAKITEKDYVAKCKAETTATQPTTATPTAAPATPPPPPAAKPPTPAVAAPAAKGVTNPKTPAAAAGGAGVGEFTTEVLAKASCPGDLVVWANLDSKIYHFSGNREYGKTKEGAYMCEKVALGQGIRAAKNEKHP
jgi:hypothetical protein